MRGPEEWPSSGSNPADRIRLIGPAANIFFWGPSAALRISAASSRFAHAPKPAQLIGPAANTFNSSGTVAEKSCQNLTTPNKIAAAVHEIKQVVSQIA